MKVAVYTSCSINYLPKARSLASSLKRHHPDATIILCLNDVIPDWLDLAAEPFDLIWQPADLAFSPGWVFKHNVMEVCTAVKGRALSRMLETIAADLYLYLDPDVYVYEPLDPMLDYMGDAQIGLVPHITKPEATLLGVQVTEMSVVAHGTYNLGHLLIRDGESARAFARWWGDRLADYCYDDKTYGLFTDQRWCDLAPALFDHVRILRQPNIDVASWNVFGRRVEHLAGGGGEPRYVIDGYPLLTYHFSGTGPTGTHRRIREMFAPCSGAVAEIERRYEEAIAANGQALLENFVYGGDFFDDGQPVTAAARLMYRKHDDLQEAFPDPYRTEGDMYYLEWLRGNRPELVSGIILDREAIERAFESIFDPEFYLSAYPDAARAVARGEYDGAMDHYIQLGSRLLHDPHPLFVSTFYYEQASKVDAKSIRLLAPPTRENTLLWHYLTVGLPNGIEPIEHFDSNRYLARNPDVNMLFRTRDVVCPFVHFIAHGDREGRGPGDLDLEPFVATSPEAGRLMATERIGRFQAFAMLGNVSGRLGRPLRH